MVYVVIRGGEPVAHHRTMLGAQERAAREREGDEAWEESLLEGGAWWLKYWANHRTSEAIAIRAVEVEP